MVLPISLFICGLIAALTIYMAIVESFRLRRTEKTDFEEILRRAENIMEALEKLPQLEGKERLAVCRAIAEDMSFHCIVLVQMVRGPHMNHPKDKGEIGKLTLAAVREAQELNLELRCFLLRLRFRPSRVKDCRRRIRRAAVKHLRMWRAFVRLWRVQYPDQFKNWPELADL